MTCVGDAVDRKVVWPDSKLVIEKVNTTTYTPVTNDATSSMGINFGVNTKCKPIDVHGTGKVA